jgi:hypothetical protein
MLGEKGRDKEKKEKPTWFTIEEEEEKPSQKEDNSSKRLRETNNI